MLRVPKYKYYYTAINLLVFAISFTFIVNLFISLKQYQEPSQIFYILSLIPPVFLLAYVFLYKSSKLYKPNIIRTQFSLLLLNISDIFVKDSVRKHEKNLLIVGNGKSGKKLTEKVI